MTYTQKQLKELKRFLKNLRESIIRYNDEELINLSEDFDLMDLSLYICYSDEYYDLQDKINDFRDINVNYSYYFKENSTLLNILYENMHSKITQLTLRKELNRLFKDILFETIYLINHLEDYDA